MRMKHKYYEVLYGGEKGKELFPGLFKNNESHFVFSAGVRLVENLVNMIPDDEVENYVLNHLPAAVHAYRSIVISVTEVPQSKCFYDSVNDELFVFRTQQAAKTCRENVLKTTSPFVPRKQRKESSI